MVPYVSPELGHLKLYFVRYKPNLKNYDGLKKNFLIKIQLKTSFKHDIE